MSHDPLPDLIVLLPGITGSRLRRGERTLWGVTPNALGRMLATRGASMCHRGAAGWGEDVHDGRMFQTFFFKVRSPRAGTAISLSAIER